MEVFHLVIDTSMLRRMHFKHADFQRLLLPSQMGKLKIYIPYIALEEERTALLTKHMQAVGEMRTQLEKLLRGMQGMLVEGLPDPHLDLWSSEDVERNSKDIFGKFITDNKIEVIDISLEHAAKAWNRYFHVEPPFNPEEPREARRKDIPDSWILEAGIEVKPRKGRHCALVGDNKLAAAFEAEGFKVYREAQDLLDDIEQATAIAPIKASQAEEEAPVPLGQLRSLAFKDVDVVILGLIDVLEMPPKTEFFDALEKAGIDREIAEHEARTMVLSGRLIDTGTHLVPTSRKLAQLAAASEAVVEVLLRIT